MSQRSIKKLSNVLTENESLPENSWKLEMVSNGDCCSYIVWNEETRELLYIDPKNEDVEDLISLGQKLSNFVCLGVVDTHTHADHISGAAELASIVQAPLIMHQASPSSRVQVRVSQSVTFQTRSGALQFIPTPGHTPDGMCVLWGPFIFTGDTVHYGDVGRDDLPGGDPAVHYESLQSLKKILSSSVLVCPGHDHRGGRISSWSTQLRVNSSLIQGKEEFVQECATFEAPAPTLFKKSLFENFK